MKINRFMSHIDSMARQNRFEVRIHKPSLHGFSNINLRGMRVSKATIPGRKIISEVYSEIPGRPPRKYPQKVENDQEVTLTFLCDNSLVDRMAIETWMESMYDIDYAMRYPYSSSPQHPSYLGTVYIKQLARDDFPIYEVKLLEAFPETLSGLSLDSSSSAIQTFDVTFAYRDWESTYKNAPSDSILGSLFKKAGKKIRRKVTQKVEDKIFGERSNLASKLGID